MYQTLLSSLQEQTQLITINRPEKLNALNKTVIEELDTAIDEAIANPLVRGIIITGAGPKAFVAGADISEFLALNQKEGTALAKKGNLVFFKIENSPKPVVAAVNGFSLGGGNELAMACHFRFCSDNAAFGQPEVNLGLIPGYGGTQRLTQLVGRGKAMELMMSGRVIKAPEALAIGLVNEVTTLEDLLPKTMETMKLIQSKAPLAINRVIDCVNLASGNPSWPAGTNGFEEEQKFFGECFATEDMKEGVTAFLEKRKPVFKGK